MILAAATSPALAQGAAAPPAAALAEPCWLHPLARTHTLPPLPPGFDPASTSAKTLLTLVVDVNGVVADASVASSSGSDALDKAAVDHVRKVWLWRPTDPSCMPISTKVLISWSPPRPPGPPPPIHTVPPRY